MKRSLGQLFRLGAGGSAATVGASGVRVRLHYRNGLGSDEIESFRMGHGTSFLLTFVGGGTVAIDLSDVREIRFKGAADCTKGPGSGTPVYQVRVAMNNGRILEGVSADLHSFSGRKSGADWNCSFKFETPERALSDGTLTRIVVLGEQRQGAMASWVD